jgi:hypothetical protein
MNEIWLSPSDLTFFWTDSRLGFYDKYVHKIHRPKLPFPAMFNTIDSCMKKAFDQACPTTIVTGAPEGTIQHNDINVQSKLITLGDFQIGFKGKMDCLLHTKDGGHYIVDYKTAHISDTLKNIYFLQLMAYAFCLEKPLHGNPKKVDGIGLIAFHPNKFDFELNQGNLSGEMAWVPMEYDKVKFGSWLTNELKPLLHSARENVFVTDNDASWNKYIQSFDIEEIPD